MNSKTIDFFKQISLIPRESGNEEMISLFIENFAKERGLDYIRDEFNNVIIKKYVNDGDPVILQAHLDMVCEKDISKTFDFKNDSIELIFKDGYITANGTTLGADNGVGVAQILNILDSDLDCNIEAIFTVNEETSMSGASNIDLSSLKGKVMINLDGFDEDTILLGSAGFTDIDILMNYKLSEKSENLYKISVSGLAGGHSGFDIDKNRGNSIILLAELIDNFSEYRIIDFKGGSKINVIPSEANAIISTTEDINNVVNNYLNNNKDKYNNLKIEIVTIADERKSLSLEDSKLFIKSVLDFNHGVINKNSRGEVTTSENLALVDLKNNLVQVGLRSSIDSEEKELINKLEDYCNNYSYKLNIIGHQPGFYTNEESILVKRMKDTYYKINNTYPLVKSLHVAVEVGLIKEKIKDLEVVIISPKIVGAHTPNEKVEIDSIEKCDRWLIKFLKDYK